MADTTGQANLRAETIEKAVKGFALQEYKFKQVCSIQRSNSWKESYYQENSTELTGGTGDAIRGIPRLAAFPYGEPNWTKQSAYLEKYGMEGVISMEDAMTNEIDVVARTLLRIARAVAKSVDDQIFSALTTASGIQTFTISTGYEWNNKTGAGILSGANIIDNLMKAKQLIQDYHYNPQNAFLLINQKDHRSIVGWLAEKGAQFPSLATSVSTNGNAGELAGFKIVVSPSVSASGALVIIGSEAATWKEAVPLTIKTMEDAGIKTTIRAWEIGVTQVHNPKAIVWIKGTDTGST
jgi:hypothetical protein